ncbi:hypothetical protein ABT025_19280 [Streptomyces sp. NPDC002809]|uniref:hypothetical protein n=1 Tax=Streptomyces sp. NPDC002809 TaxID=3154433 RepID=UPI00331D9620
MHQQRRRAFRVRAGVVLATLCAAVGTLLSAPAPAWAASCSGFGCDGHDPSIQTWQYGPRSQAAREFANGYSIEMRSGTTDGDFYVWARTRYPSGSDPYNHSMYIERCHNDYTVCEILGETQPGADGKTVSDPESSNYSITRSPMYYDVGRVSRACLYRSGDWARRTCTTWY